MNISNSRKNRINKNNIPADVLLILTKLENSGFAAFLVGGCMRDLLLKRNVRDWDILTNALPEQIEAIFYEYKTIVIGKYFRTVTVILNKKVYQISSLKNYLLSFPYLLTKIKKDVLFAHPYTSIPRFLLNE